jgi:uncharacterized protein
MQIFLLSRRSTASGNGMGGGGPERPYKTCGGRRSPFPPPTGAAAVTSDAEGELAVRVARTAVIAAVRGERPAPPAGPLPARFTEPTGVFVTLKRYPGGALRGCIGLPLPTHPLAKALHEAAVAAATEDPRFPAVLPEEVPRLTVEVSVLTPPEVVPAPTPASIPQFVEVGRDGLVVAGYRTSGLLLPQVATELGWSAEEFLDGTCEKAGLPAGAWKDARVRVSRFRAEVFRETAPDGPVEREALQVTPPNARPGR